VASVLCESCFTRVLPGEGGVCPACRGPVRPEGGPRRTLVRISERATLPNLCCRCAAPERRRVTVRARAPTRSWPRALARGAAWGALIFVGAGSLLSELSLRIFALLDPDAAAPAALQIGAWAGATALLAAAYAFRQELRRADHISLRLPLCAACASADPPDLRAPDANTREASLVVHSDFRVAIQPHSDSALADIFS
jgi:hypothetical protein